MRGVGTFLAVQWSGLCPFTAEDMGSSPGWGNKIPQVMGMAKKKKGGRYNP